MTDESREQEPPEAPAEEQRGLQQAIEVRHGDSGSPAVEGLAKEPKAAREAIFRLDDVAVSYSGKPAVRDVSFDIAKNEITALIGPSGCGKSTLIRCLNRMNDLIPGRQGRRQGASTTARTSTHPRSTPWRSANGSGWSSRSRIPFPKSIFDNIAFGPRVLGMKGKMEEIVERALSRAALWDEVKDRLKTNAFGMSGGQQQRLCIARCLAVEPDVILMDEPCSALDPISTGKIEDLMLELEKEYSIVIVTHNMQQAARVSDKTAFFTVELSDDDHRTGRVVEFDDTEKIFTNPSDSAHGGLRHRQGRVAWRNTTRTHFQEELKELETQALGGLDMVITSLDRALETVQHQDVELAAWSSPTTTASTAATSRCTRASSRCWRARRRWPATSAWWPRSCT